MGEVELSPATGELLIRSVLVFYGEASSPQLAKSLADDVARYWNEPGATVTISNHQYKVRFIVTGVSEPDLDPERVWYNDDPALNFFRIEEYADGNISFVDGLGSNTGYFKLDNLLQTGSTIAHEFGHTLGLPHPAVLDVRGQGTPGIMYPRGTLCDAPMQYDPLAAAGAYGGVMDPAHRKVLPSEIADLRLHKLSFDQNGKSRLGDFTSLYHQKHNGSNL
jgi:hypothetical protein